MNFKKLTYLCMQKLTNFPYIEADFDALTNYELLCKVVEYLNKVIANENNQNEAIAELAEKFTELKNYIDNLDLQDEVNNKLDEMAEDGTLANLIAQYLDTNALFEYDTVNDLKNSNLGVGSHAKTNGYYELNDGGEAEYIIREKENSDVENGGSIIFLNNNLVAEMIVEKVVNVLSWGVKKQDSSTQTNLNNLLSYYNNGNIAIFFPSGEYYLAETIYLPQRTKIYGNGNSSIIRWYGNANEYIFNIKRGIRFCTISNMYIDGRNLAYGIIDCDYTNMPSGNRGVRSRFYDLILENMILGIRLDGMGSEIHNILINGSGENGSYSNNNSIGLFINGTDNYINSVRIQLFYYGSLILGANNRLVTVKCCVNVIGCELRPGESGFYNIDLQENKQDNMIMKETIESTLLMNNQTAGFSDTYSNDIQYSLLKMEKCHSINIIGTLGCRTKLGNGNCGNEKYAIYIDPLTTYVNAEFSYIYPIDIETAQLTKPIFYCYDTDNNKIVVNNKQLESTSTFTDAVIADTWSLSTMSYFATDDNYIQATYKETLDFNQEQVVLNFVLDNQENPQTVEIDCSKIIFSKVWLNVAAPSHGSYGKHVNYGIDFTNLVNFEGGSKLKFTYIGDTALLSQYGQQIEDLIGYPVERISFQVFGYIENRQEVYSYIEVAT